MKRTVSVLIVGLAVSAMAQTQTQKTSAPAPTTVTTSPAPAAQTVTVTTIAAPAADLVKQPTTVVEAAPLSSSKADEMRKAREGTEVETEQRIVEKLEQSRIDDEKRRQEKILGSITAASAVAVAAEKEKAAEKQEEKKPEQKAPEQKSPDLKSEVAPQQVIVVTQPQPQVQPSPVAPAGATKEEVHGIIQEELAKTKKEDSKKYFFSGSVGSVNYNNSSDIKTFGAFGLSFGEVLPSNVAVSADIAFNNLNQDMDPLGLTYRSIDQYSLGMTGRFMLMTGRVRPSIGAALDYVRRQYSDIRNAWGSGSINGLGKMNSNALDGGVVGAVDLAVSDNLSLALEYRYMMNMTYKYENENALNTAGYQNLTGNSLLESRNYQTWMFALRYTY